MWVCVCGVCSRRTAGAPTGVLRLMILLRIEQSAAVAPAVSVVPLSGSFATLVASDAAVARMSQLPCRLGRHGAQVVLVALVSSRLAAPVSSRSECSGARASLESPLHRSSLFQIAENGCPMVEFSHVIRDAQGLHARPVAQICAAASAWGSAVTVSCADASVSARDLMGLMDLCARKGDELVVRVEGEDEDDCAEALREVFCF